MAGADYSFENDELKQESTVPSEEIFFGHLFDNDHGVVAGENEVFFFDIKGRIKPSRIVTSERDLAKVELSNDQKSLLCFPANGPCKMHVLDVAKKSCLGRKDFDRDLFFEPQMTGSKNASHTATGKRLDDFVIANLFEARFVRTVGTRDANLMGGF